MTSARGASRPRFRLLSTLLLTLAILGLPTVVYAWGRSSSSFDIVKVKVDGTRLSREKRALRLLRREYAGRNLFTVTAGDVRDTLRPLCFVSGVTIDRDFPETLAVTVTEYVPAAYALAGDRWYVLDEEGHAVCAIGPAAGQAGSKGSATAKPSPRPSASASAAATGDGPATDGGEQGTPAEDEAVSVAARLLAGPDGATLPLPRIAVPGRVREGTVVQDEAVAEMLRVVTALPGSLRRRLAVVQNDDGQITLRFAGGPVATWGDSERTLAKTVALRTVLAHYEDAGSTCTELDVSIPDRVIARPVLQ
jgi:hypothetical protein